jgi:hypothetical protein
LLAVVVVVQQVVVVALVAIGHQLQANQLAAAEY